jgi:hypothetical protein
MGRGWIRGYRGVDILGGRCRGAVLDRRLASKNLLLLSMQRFDYVLIELFENLLTL